MNTLKRSSIIALVLSLHFAQSTLVAQQLDLGRFTATNISGSSLSNNFPPSEAFNGITKTSGDGWLGDGISSQNLTFDFDLQENTNFDITENPLVELKLKIWSGAVSGFTGVENFQIRANESGGTLNSSATLTDYTSFSGVKREIGSFIPPDDTPIVMSLDAEGLFTTETFDNEYQAVYTIVFNVPSTTARMRLHMPVSPSRSQYTIEEIRLSAVVPEPSSYALLLASGMILFVGLRRRSTKK